jgi:hypothetical protein
VTQQAYSQLRAAVISISRCGINVATVKCRTAALTLYSISAPCTSGANNALLLQPNTDSEALYKYDVRIVAIAYFIACHRHAA